MLPRPAPGENFHNISGGSVVATCNNCSYPNTTQYYYAQNSNANALACMNGINKTQIDWTGFCMCAQTGDCFSFGALPGGSATLASVVNASYVVNNFGNSCH